MWISERRAVSLDGSDLVLPLRSLPSEAPCACWLRKGWTRGGCSDVLWAQRQGAVFGIPRDRPFHPWHCYLPPPLLEQGAGHFPSILPPLCALRSEVTVPLLPTQLAPGSEGGRVTVDWVGWKAGLLSRSWWGC